MQLYETSEYLLDSLAAYVRAALTADRAAIVVAVEPHLEQLTAHLDAAGLNVGALRTSGEFVPLDAHALLAEFMIDGVPDPSRFAATVGDLLQRAREGRSGVSVYGEMVAILALSGNQPAALALERLWNELREVERFDLLCGYPLHAFGAADLAQTLQEVCHEHDRVIPSESYSAAANEGERLQAIALLQQRAASLEREIEERRRAEAQLREQTAALETINRIGRMITAELDLDALVQEVTDSATRLIGAEFGAFFYNVVDQHGESYMLYTLSGAPIEKFSQFPMPRNTSIFGPTFRGEGVVRIDDVRLDPRYGKNVPYNGIPEGHLPVVSYLAVPVISRQGDVLGGLFFGHSQPGVFTERAERIVVGLAAQTAVAMDNARLYRQAQDAVRTRDEFLLAASHDLRTPLTVMLGQAQGLQRFLQRRGDGQERVFAALGSIQRGARMMASVIDELVDATKLQAGQQVSLARECVELAPLLHDVAATIQHSSSRHAIRLELADERIVGNWDQVRLTRVLTNLLSNAVKYSPSGGDIVLAASTETRDGQDWVSITVRDQGMGIPAGELPLIFERFYRARNAIGKTAGTGIGLATAKHIVELHGGEIAVESQEGSGTTITVLLPVGSAGEIPESRAS